MTLIGRSAVACALLWFGVAAAAGHAEAAPAASRLTAVVHLERNGVDIAQDHDTVSIRVIAPGIVRVHYKPDGKTSAPTLVVDPQAKQAAFDDAHVQQRDHAVTLSTPRLGARLDEAGSRLLIEDASHTRLAQLDLTTLAHGRIVLQHAADDALYGLSGYDNLENASAGLLRGAHIQAKAGAQGHAGAPLVWSTAGYGLLVDTDGADFDLSKDRITVDKISKTDLDFYLFVGTPAQIFAAVAQVSGHSQLFPKWAMGFTNSQWGIDQKQLLSIIDTYRAKHIPIDNFTLDFDWKDWGKDWGEFRWNPVKFPDGPSGKLKQELDARHMHLTGIMKPRVHVDTIEGRYATTHDLWIDGRTASPDYFSLKPVRDLDFNKPATRAWFFNGALKHSFDTGIVGWWNDEADNDDNTQFLNMERALYDGQRAYSKLRVWSINRNFYLGSQRYAYGLWSGDIPTGFASMAAQRQRMLSAINVGAMQWGMDGGGFTLGTPTPENYARWIEFGAFTPIFRVHGELGQRRQPWVYGAVAEKAAADAIRLRYALIPYIYSYEYRRHVSGVGLVRPLLFDWPHDVHVRNDSASWLFGDYLLVSPVVQPGQTAKDIYLPAGLWTDWFSGKKCQGGQIIHLAIDSKSWGDIPLFIRDGAIIPTRAPQDFVGEHPLTELDVDVFPATRRSTFDYYDDDGSTYGYEHGAYFSQTLAVQQAGRQVTLDIAAAVGSFRPALKFYLLRVHGGTASKVSGHGALKRFDSLDALQHSGGEGWARGNDRFGAVTYVRVKAATARRIALTWGR